MRISVYSAGGAEFDTVIVPQVDESGLGYHGIAASRIAYAVIDRHGGATIDSTYIDDLSYRTFLSNGNGDG